MEGQRLKLPLRVLLCVILLTGGWAEDDGLVLTLKCHFYLCLYSMTLGNLVADSQRNVNLRHSCTSP